MKKPTNAVPPDPVLAKAPKGKRELELWLQHAAGFILVEYVRRYALNRIDPKLPSKARQAVEKGINDTIYGLMMAIDGVTGSVSNDEQSVEFRAAVRLVDQQSGKTLKVIDLADGDGMCLGYHGWMEGDFGKNPIVAPTDE